MSTLGVLVVLAFDDQVLLDAARTGDTEAMDTLYRQHSPALRRVALALDPGRADDLVSEAFTRVFAALRAGRGPDRNLLGYLATTVRRLHLDYQRTGNHETPSSDRDWLLDQPHTHELLDPVDERRAAEALKGLPKRWREVLWFLDVEDLSIAEVAERLGVPAPRVSTWAYRAREALRRGYLSGHVMPAERLPCRWTRERLSALVRGGLGPAGRNRVLRHLDDCFECAAAHQQLASINTHLGAWTWPVVVTAFAGIPAAAWLVPAGTTGAAALPSPARRLREWLTQPAGIATATSGLVAVGVGSVMAATLLSPPDAAISSERPSSPKAADISETMPGPSALAPPPAAPSDAGTPSPPPAASEKPGTDHAPERPAVEAAPTKPPAPDRPAPSPSPGPDPDIGGDPEPEPEPEPALELLELTSAGVSGDIVRSLEIAFLAEGRGTTPITITAMITLDRGVWPDTPGNGWTCQGLSFGTRAIDCARQWTPGAELPPLSIPLVSDGSPRGVVTVSSALPGAPTSSRQF